MVVIRIAERALRKTNIETISNLIGRQIEQTTALSFIYSVRMQSYVIDSSFKAHCRTEQQIRIELIRFCYKFILHYYRSAI